MAVTLNALEIFEIAEQIEQNGAEFYRRAADIFGDPENRKILLELADWEIKHKEFFAEMKQQLSETNPDNQPSLSEQFLPEAKVMAGLAVFGIRSNPADELSGRESETEILKSAIEKEKDSIVFYSGLKDFTPTEMAKEKIDEIIREELRHIRILNKLWDRSVAYNRSLTSES